MSVGATPLVVITHHPISMAHDAERKGVSVKAEAQKLDQEQDPS